MDPAIELIKAVCKPWVVNYFLSVTLGWDLTNFSVDDVVFLLYWPFSSVSMTSLFSSGRVFGSVRRECDLV